MSITDELRLFAADPYTCWVPTDKQQADLRAIADRIDAEHERRCREQYACGAEDGISASIDALVIQTHGFIELPKDADDEYVHVGDMMERGEARGRVIALMLSNYPKKWGGALHWGIQLEGEQAPTALDRFFHHYHAPTVEDVLREFANEVYADADNEIRDRDFLCAKYAKRLKLAEGEDA